VVEAAVAEVINPTPIPQSGDEGGEKQQQA